MLRSVLKFNYFFEENPISLEETKLLITLIGKLSYDDLVDLGFSREKCMALSKLFYKYTEE